jgi:predicted DNA binding protein
MTIPAKGDQVVEFVRARMGAELLMARGICANEWILRAIGERSTAGTTTIQKSSNSSWQTVTITRGGDDLWTIFRASPIDLLITSYLRLRIDKSAIGNDIPIAESRCP